MKNLKYYIGFASMALALGACSDTDKLVIGYDNNDVAVHFKAAVGKAISRAEGSEYVASGTNIGMTDADNYISYVAGENGDLAPTNSDVFISWAFSSELTKDIKAYAPYSNSGSAESFTIPADQSSAEKYAAADFITFVGTVEREAGSQDVTFEMQHRLAQINMAISSVDSRYTDTDENTYTFDVSVISPSTAVTVTYDGETTVTGDGQSLEITPNGGSGMVKDATATAVVAPATLSNAQFIAVQVKKNDEAEGTPLIAFITQELKPGYSYTYNLEINIDALTVSSVQVTDWGDSNEITGGKADDAVYTLNINDYSSETEIYNALDKALKGTPTYKYIALTGTLGEMSLNKILRNDSKYNGGTVLPFVNVDLSGITDLTELTGFYNCRTLKSINAPQVTSVADYTFTYCTTLTEVSLPAATSIGTSAFYNCTSLTQVSLPVATSISYCAFYYCTSLTQVSLPAATSIGASAFEQCTALTEVSLPAATSIGNQAFQSCTSLTKVSMPKASSFGSNLFSSVTTSNIDLVLSSSQKSNVSGTTWTYKYQSGSLSCTQSYTFKSISYKSE